MLPGAREALFALDAGCARDMWVRIGMAAKAAGIAEEDFLCWSATADNYAGEGDCHNVWRSIKPDGAVTERTLFGMARDAGWRGDGARPLNGQAAHATSTARPSGDGRQRAAALWARCLPAPLDFPYIAHKFGTPEGLRVVPVSESLVVRGQRVAGWLAVPVNSLKGGEPLTLQFIPPEGAKLNFPGASFGEDGHFMVGPFDPAGTLYVCEGIGAAWACWRTSGGEAGNAACVTFGAGRTLPVCKALREAHPNLGIVVVCDKGKEQAGERAAREVGGRFVTMPEDMPRNADAADLEPDTLFELLAGPRQPEAPATRYRLLTADELCALPPQRWMVREVLPAEGIGAGYGPPHSGKSFLFLDLAAALAEGLPWFGHATHATPVVYLALEGQGGLSKRVKAWHEHHGGTLPARLRFVLQPFCLRDAADVAALVEAVKATGLAGGLLIVDTLNRASGGADENNARDMGELVDAVAALQRELGGFVLLLHHAGKDAARGLRGHSSLLGALDVVIELTGGAGEVRTWQTTKVRDGELQGPHAFRLESVALPGAGFDGEPQTSAVAVPALAEPVSAPPPRQPRGDNQRIALDALGPALRDSRDFGKGKAPPMRPCLALEAAIDVVAPRLLVDAKRRRERAMVAIRGLVAGGVLGLAEDWLWRV